MKMLFTGAKVYHKGRLSTLDMEVQDGIIVSISQGISPHGFDQVFHFPNHIIVPGFADVHVHLREPGFSYKETIATGTRAAAAGGYTVLCAMPNLNPPPDSPEHLGQQLALIRQQAVVPVLPYAAITVGQQGEGQLVDFAALAPYVFGFSDDGRGVQRGELMEEAMRQVRQVGGFIAAHCEDDSLLQGGYIHQGAYAAAHGHRGISSQSEWGQIARDVELVAKTGCRYHVCHISTKESVEIIRQAKGQGLPVTCETAPHYLLLCDQDLEEDGRFKMNPPLRGREDQEALLEGLRDGTIDMIATDHAPHSAEEKAKGLAGSAMGVVGLETAFPVLYTRLVEPGIIPLEKLIQLMSLSPREQFTLPGGEIMAGLPLDAAVIDLDQGYTIQPQQFESKGRSTPFAGWEVRGRIKMTIAGGNIVWEKN